MGQATKEAEYRERVADLKARIDSYQERIAAEEGHCRSAKVRWSLLVVNHPSEAMPLTTTTAVACQCWRLSTD